jgi:hypothetical protein
MATVKEVAAVAVVVLVVMEEEGVVVVVAVAVAVVVFSRASTRHWRTQCFSRIGLRWGE